MPFITTPERVGMRRGMREGIEALLQVRFGDEGLKLMPEIEEIHEEETLRTVLKTLGTGASLEEVHQTWLPQGYEGYCQGLRESIELLLRRRFGDEGSKCISDVQEVNKVEILLSVLKALKSATSLEEVRRLWSLSDK